MRPSHLGALTAISALGILAAPVPAQALTFNVTIANPGAPIAWPGTTLSFPGTSTLPVPAGYTLAKVSATIAGTPGGTITVTNFNPAASAIPPIIPPLVSNGSETLHLNNTGNEQSVSFTPTIIPGATVGPPFTPSTTIVSVANGPRTFAFDIWRGAPYTPIPGLTPATTAGDFSPLTVSLPNAYMTADPDFTVGGPFVSANNSTFTMLAGPTNSFITYEFVPGPLPILGAGAAFGWSRRLRRRIGKAA